MTAQTEQNRRSVTSVVKGFMDDQGISSWDAMDSLSTMEALVEVEDAFSITLPISEFDGPMALEDFVSKVCRILSKRWG